MILLLKLPHTLMAFLMKIPKTLENCLFSHKSGQFPMAKQGYQLVPALQMFLCLHSMKKSICKQRNNDIDSKFAWQD